MSGRGAVFGRPLAEHGPTATQLRARAAAALGPVADDPAHVAAQLVAVAVQPHRDEAHVVEHAEK